jgi:hypothetical protein
MSEIVTHRSPKPGYKRGLFVENGRLFSTRYIVESDVRVEAFPRPRLKRKLDTKRRKFRWIRKRYPKLTTRLGKAKAGWCAWTGQDDDGWWQEMVDRFGS